MIRLHPAFRLACWLLLVVVLQCLNGIALAVAFALPLLAGRGVAARWWRLLRRTRWLILSLLLVLAFNVAGTPLWGDGWPSPTQEGVLEAATQIGRLALVLAAVAALLETTPMPTLMAGCHGLLWPFQRLGINSDRAVARLMLTLHYAEALPAPRHWRDLLVPVSGDDGPSRVVLERAPIRVQDWLALAVAVGGLVAVCLP